jgi:hypothetical protein
VVGMLATDWLSRLFEMMTVRSCSASWCIDQGPAKRTNPAQNGLKEDPGHIRRIRIS